MPEKKVEMRNDKNVRAAKISTFLGKKLRELEKN